VYFVPHAAIKKRLDKDGLTIPFPQQDILMHQAARNSSCNCANCVIVLEFSAPRAPLGKAAWLVLAAI
jgi:hypothetical protein